ncbi:formylglycine-generating enzyme family protein [Propionivibrio sp.]|uniref:formylglycine-generating enzyme family protein n=1 Tax=Propionivibrio sp. TaxID=2212460 RepID=UPI003BF297BF
MHVIRLTTGCSAGLSGNRGIFTVSENLSIGLYDMIGNAWEWTEDCWNKSYAGAPSDGSAWTTGECSVGRVLRGGSWSNGPADARAALRYRDGASIRYIFAGFRPARMLP